MEKFKISKYKKGRSQNPVKRFLRPSFSLCSIMSDNYNYCIAAS
jgi:hypothetical protein